MSWYELLLTLHILAAALWFGSGVTLTVLSYWVQRREPDVFPRFSALAGGWAGRAHPAAAVVILLVGFGMLAEADISIGETWIVLALVGWVVLLGLGGGLLSPTGVKLTEAYERSGGATTDETRAIAGRLLTLMRVESVIVVLVIVDMVAKPGA